MAKHEPMFISRSETFKFIAGDIIVLPCEVANTGEYTNVCECECECEYLCVSILNSVVIQMLWSADAGHMCIINPTPCDACQLTATMH